jgi:hypothetical protein
MQQYHVLSEFWVHDHRRELERRASKSRAQREAIEALRVRVEEGKRRPPVPRPAPVVVRRSRAQDRPELARLARDPRLRPEGEFVVAERAGALVAAVPLAGRGELVDPAGADADLVALVRLRAEQLRQQPGRRAA